MLTYCCHLQIWLSPFQVAHGIAVVGVFKDTMPRPSESRNSSATAVVEDEATAALAMTEAEAMRRRMQLTLSAEIPVLSVICFVSLLAHVQPPLACP